eukprot:NODE_435_length_8649_cov_0.394386.p5 type:complete len:154 gc:universal NODE_435_length_8649_cov_0.394386:1505-1966(+)
MDLDSGTIDLTGSSANLLLDSVTDSGDLYSTLIKSSLSLFGSSVVSFDLCSIFSSVCCLFWAFSSLSSIFSSSLLVSFVTSLLSFNEGSLSSLSDSALLVSFLTSTFFSGSPSGIIPNPIRFSGSFLASISISLMLKCSTSISSSCLIVCSKS